MAKVGKAVGVYEQPAPRRLLRRPVLYAAALAVAAAVAAIVVLT